MEDGEIMSRLLNVIETVAEEREGKSCTVIIRPLKMAEKNVPATQTIPGK